MEKYLLKELTVLIILSPLNALPLIISIIGGCFLLRRDFMKKIFRTIIVLLLPIAFVGAIIFGGLIIICQKISRKIFNDAKFNALQSILHHIHSF